MQITRSLRDVYPDAGDELCSRHSAHLTLLKNNFEHLYSGVKPTFYVLAKGVCQITPSSTLLEVGLPSLSMAIQNGVVISGAKTEPGKNIYINYNKWQNEVQQKESQGGSNTHTLSHPYLEQFQQEMILDYKGQPIQQPTLSQNTAQLAKKLRIIYQIAVEDMSLTKINGGIIYIHSHLQDGHFYEQQALLYAFYTTILAINGVLHEYEPVHVPPKLQAAMRDAGITKQNDQYRLLRYGNIFAFQDRCFLRGNQLIKFPERHKFIFLKLIANLKFSKIKGGQNGQNGQNSFICDLLKYQSKEFASGIQDYESLLVAMQKIKYYFMSTMTIQSSVATNLNKIMPILQSIVKNEKCIQGLFGTQNQYLVLLVSTRDVPEMVGKFCKVIKKQISEVAQLDSPDNCDLLEMRNKRYPWIQNKKWGRNEHINKLVFSSSPSIGLSILDPATEIWFAQ